MLSVFFTFAAAMILVAGIVINQNRVPEEIIPESEDQQVLSEEDENTEDNEEDQVENEGDDSDVSVQVNEDNSSINIQITDSPTQNREQQTINQGNRLDYYIYSNSSIVSRNDTSILLNSEDNPDHITDWYKQRLESQDMNVNSFVSTNTNNNVKNELVSSDGTIEIRIKIEKDAGENTSRLEVTLS